MTELTLVATDAMTHTVFLKQGWVKTVVGQVSRHEHGWTWTPIGGEPRGPYATAVSAFVAFTRELSHA